MPAQSGINLTVASQDADTVTFTVDITGAKHKTQADKRSLWVSLTSLDENGAIVVANNLPVRWDGDSLVGIAGPFGVGAPGKNFAYVWDNPDSSVELTTLQF